MSLLESNTVLIKVLDEINVVVMGLAQRDHTHFYDRYGEFSKNYRFNPRYKMGRWDGKIRFFDKGGKTSINLMPEIIPEIKRRGYKIKLVDHRNPAITEVPEINEDFLSDVALDDGSVITLGEHQVNAVNAATLNAGGIILAATGAGKSYICAALMRLYNEFCKFRVMVVVPNKDLINQTALDVQNMGVKAGRYFGDVKEPDVHNVVTTWQSLQNNPTLMSAFDVIIVDECHGAAGNVLKQMLLEQGSHAKVRIGLTGTLPKDKAEAMSIKYVLGEVVSTVPAHVLIDKGWLAKPNLEVITLEEDFTGEWNYYKEKAPEEASQTTYKKFKRDFFPEYAGEKSYLHKNALRRSWIAEKVKKAVTESGNAFVLVNSVPFGRKLAEELGAHFVYGGDEGEVRRQIYALFAENNDVIVVTTFQLASTGLNIKRIFNLFLIDAGKSFIQIIQSIGRGLRKASDKDSVNIYDIGGDLKYGWKHVKERIKYYKEVKYDHTHVVIQYTQLSNENVDTDDPDVVY
jgi:superfamily II DNA or RNA helicase